MSRNLLSCFFFEIRKIVFLWTSIYISHLLLCLPFLMRKDVVNSIFFDNLRRKMLSRRISSLINIYMKKISSLMRISNLFIISTCWCLVKKFPLINKYMWKYQQIHPDDDITCVNKNSKLIIKREKKYRGGGVNLMTNFWPFLCSFQNVLIIRQSRVSSHFF